MGFTVLRQLRPAMSKIRKKLRIVLEYHNSLCLLIICTLLEDIDFKIDFRSPCP